MTAPHKEFWSKWLPVVITLMGWGVTYGMLRQDVSNLRVEVMPMEKRLEVFVTRREYNDVKQLIRDTNEKVDYLYRQEVKSPQ